MGRGREWRGERKGVDEGRGRESTWRSTRSLINLSLTHFVLLLTPPSLPVFIGHLSDTWKQICLGNLFSCFGVFSFFLFISSAPFIPPWWHPFISLCVSEMNPFAWDLLRSHRFFIKSFFCDEGWENESLCRDDSLGWTGFSHSRRVSLPSSALCLSNCCYGKEKTCVKICVGFTPSVKDE